MRLAPWLALLAVLILVAPLRAQFWYPPGPGMGMPSGGRRIVMIGFPGFGYAPYPGYGMRSGVIVVMPPAILRDPLRPMPPADEPPPAKEKEEKEKPIPFDPDGVLVIRPKPGGAKAFPPPKQMPEPPPKVAPLNANVPPALNEPARQAPPPEKDKVAEAARQIKLGREAFADGEYGRAAERFRQALRVAPDQAVGHFLSAQALFAMGKYRDSVASIYDGMKGMPDWPKERFPPRELYSGTGGDFPVHLDRLRQAVEANPADPALQFLYGYQLWFDGRRTDAKPHLQKAATGVADPKPIERFLDELKKIN